MTFFYFLRGLWLRISLPVRHFYVETVRFGNPIPALTNEQLTRLRAEKEAATAARAERIANRLPSEHSVKRPKDADVIIVVEPPLLRGNVEENIKRLKRGAK
jgi:hypothetical protein